MCLFLNHQVPSFIMDRCLSDTAESKASILFLSGARAPRFVSIITRNSGIVFYRLIFLPSSPLLKRDHLSGLAYCPRSSRTQETRPSVKLQFSCDVLYQIVLACTRQKKRPELKRWSCRVRIFPQDTILQLLVLLCEKRYKSDAMYIVY